MFGLRHLRSSVASVSFRRAHVAVSVVSASAGSSSTSVESAARWYSATSIKLAEEAKTKQKKELTPEEMEERRARAEERKHRKLMAQDYNNRRAAYKRQVSVLRKQYADEHARWKKEQEASKSTEQEKLTRQRLERQRLKNIRTAQNAIKQEEFRKAREKEFQEHLAKQQIIREDQEERQRRARQMVIDELEEEAPLWLTTPEEIEAAFTHESEQLLWARPGGFIGAPNPSMDTHFWQFQTHAQQFRRTYPLMRDIFLEDQIEIAYQEANVDPNFWTPERVAEHEKLEERARLRALVQTAGRQELLRKQRQLIETDADKEAEDDDRAILKRPAVPSMNWLADKEALEREGAKLLLKDPTRFFHFEDPQQNESPESPDTERDGDEDYEGPTLGAPIRLRDPVRDNTPDGNPWPRIIAKMEKPDTRTEREKKQRLREIKLMEAAETAARDKAAAGGAAMEVDLEKDEDYGEDIDYDALPYDSDEEEWFKGLDPEKDQDIMNIPAHLRYKEDDFAFVLEKLEKTVDYQHQELQLELENLKQEMRSERRMLAQSTEEQNFQEGSLEDAVLKLSADELVALSDLDEAYKPDMPQEELQAFMKKIPGLTEEQIMTLMTRNREE